MPVKRYSRQRELIYRTLKASHEHPTAEMIYQALKPTNPNLSLGTVYRNLNLLVEEGIIARMSFQVERYDADLSPHAHFACSCCVLKFGRRPQQWSLSFIAVSTAATSLLR